MSSWGLDCRQGKKNHKEDVFFVQDKTNLALEEEMQTAQPAAVLFIALLLKRVKNFWQETASKQVSCVGDLERR